MTAQLDSAVESPISAAERFLREHLVWDNHACMPLRPGDDAFLPQMDRFRRIGGDVISLNIGFGPYSLEDHVRVLAHFRRWVKARPDQYVLLDTLADIDAARAAGKMAVTFDMEGMAPLDSGDDGLVEMFYDLGVRWMLVAYNRNNAAGGGCHDDDAGLTDHGRRVLAEMKRVGMVVCCSHTGHRTARQVIDAADAPVIFSHSNPAGVASHARNIPDDLIKACASNGGVIGINGIGFFLGDNDIGPRKIADHIDYVVQLVGPKAVGISLDYVFDEEEVKQALATLKTTFPDPSAYAGPAKLAGPEAFVGIVASLMDRGYTSEDLAGIVGGNWRRVAQSVWR